MNPTQKIADIYKRMRLDEAKKKMDPVGDADADIDNDGDVDDSDEYLHKRRKAIKKSMKEAAKCPECGKVHEGECEDDDDDMEEAMEIDPDDGETKKVTGKEKKKKGQETETSVEEAALTVGMKQPVKVDDTEEKGHMDAVKATKAGPGKAKENKAKKLKELRK